MVSVMSATTKTLITSNTTSPRVRRMAWCFGLPSALRLVMVMVSAPFYHSAMSDTLRAMVFVRMIRIRLINVLNRPMAAE